MPSPPLPPRIALTDDPPVVHFHAPKRGRRSKEAGLEGGEVQAGGQAFTNCLALGVIVLMLALAGMVWKLSKAQERAEGAAKQVAMAWNFSDGVLEDLAQAREQAAKVAGQRETLIRVLGDAERLHASLRREFSTWQQKHGQMVESSERALAQLSQYGETLESSLGTTQAQLAEASQTLQQERTASGQQIAQLDDEKSKAELEADALAQQKNAAERAANMLDQTAKGLDNDNARLQGEIIRLRGSIGTLETENTAEQLRNATLLGEISRLREKVASLESRLQAAEKDRDKDRDKGKH